jgi:hypothetical protein
MYTIQYNHRLVLVYADDVTATEVAPYREHSAG